MCPWQFHEKSFRLGLLLANGSGGYSRQSCLGLNQLAEAIDDDRGNRVIETQEEREAKSASGRYTSLVF